MKSTIKMSLTLQPIFTNKNATSSFSPPHFTKPPNLRLPPPNPRTHFPGYRFSTSQPHLLRFRKVNASSDEPYGASHSQFDGISGTSNEFNLDAFLSILEFLSLASAAALSIYVPLSRGGVLGWVGSKILVWQCVVLVSGAVVGAVIRQRQWRRICGSGFSRGSGPSGVNLSARVDKLEEDLRSSATIIRVLSRQLEKLGTRVRVTRKALKEPISETAALAQKNSEATRALAAQEDILENELGEIQKVLLAMQEQQQKQLELILAIGKAGKLLETQRAPATDPRIASDSKSSVHGVPNTKTKQTETMALQKQANNDVA